MSGVLTKAAIVFLVTISLSGCGGPQIVQGTIISVPDANVEVLSVSKDSVEHQSGRLHTAAIREDDTLVLVDFWATWCGPCKAMNPHLEKLKRQWGDKLVVLKVDIDDRENSALTGMLKVRSVPSLMICRSGKILTGRSGFHSYDQLNRILRALQ